MLATAGDLPADDTGWNYEIKWDGIRAICHAGERGRLFSRAGHELTAGFPELHGLAAALAGTQAILDGEIVAPGEDGVPSFSALQHRIGISAPRRVRVAADVTPVTYVVFDLLALAGEPLLAEPYWRRRARLDGLTLAGPHWAAPGSLSGVSGAGLLAASRARRLEGIVAKQADSHYLPGRRSRSWRKIKNVFRQEAVVGGWEPGRVRAVGSLLVGVHGPAGLEYAGRVGTGFSRTSAADLAGILGRLRRESSPFSAPVPGRVAQGVIWADPRLVVEVAFAGWTSSGAMRAASYKGIRFDRTAGDVGREALIPKPGGRRRRAHPGRPRWRAWQLAPPGRPRYRGGMGGRAAGAAYRGVPQPARIYRVHLAGCAEARHLADPDRGPLSADDFGGRMPGTIQDMGGGKISFDELALTTLAGLGLDVDGRVTYRQGRAFLHFGRVAYPVLGH
jgi:bifunctional non-homologous end joining protein LigD